MTDAANSKLHIFDNRPTPPRQVLSISVRDQPGWISFGIDGRFGYPSSGEVIEVQTHRKVAFLTDENNTAVQSEKLLEIDFAGSKPVKVGNQFGLGDRPAKAEHAQN